jgi:thiamine biosynthesis lipoprotein
MASELQLVTIAADGSPDTMWSDGAIDLLDHLEARWSRFLPDSDVSRLNLAVGRPVQVDPTTITLLLAMIDAWHTTEQRFDPTTLPALLAAGYRSSIDDPRRVTLLPAGAFHLDGLEHHHAPFGHATVDSPTLGDIEIDRLEHTVRLPAGLAIDAGGIGKGLAADLAVAHLLGAGAVGAMASIGGDISMGGQPPGRGWNILVEQPHRRHDGHDLVGTIAVNAGGVATSSTTSRRWQHDGTERHHLIDPWTSSPSTTDLSSVTVVARSGWLAEAHATAAILGGSLQVIDYLDRHELSGLAFTADDRVLATDDLAGLRTEHAMSSTGNPR